MKIGRGAVPSILVTRFDADAGEDLLGRDELISGLSRAVLGNDASVFGRTTFDVPSVSLDEVLDAAREVSLLSPAAARARAGSKLAAGSEVGGDERAAGGSPDEDASAPPERSEREERRPSSRCSNATSRARPRGVHRLRGMSLGRPPQDPQDPSRGRDRCGRQPSRSPAGPGWIESRVRSEKGRIEPDAASLLAELRGNDTMRLAAEIEKLLLYAGGSQCDHRGRCPVPSSRREDAHGLGPGRCRGRRRCAARALRDESPARGGEAAPAIVGALASRLRQMIVLCDEKAARQPDGTRRGRSSSPDGRSISRTPWRARPRRFSPRALTDALSALYDVDRRTKSSSLDAGALLEEWLVALLQTTRSVRS